MDDQAFISSNSPITLEELYKIEQTKLPPMERHHLRLLAHCLSCFKTMVNQQSVGPLPNQKDRLKWCLNQRNIGSDKEFAEVLDAQFAAAAIQLEKIALIQGVTPLELTLQDLIKAIASPPI
tara:strand:- start:896 stop:1261 length:366 start_codon:yes stop_codon:yes gene_type:complete